MLALMSALALTVLPQDTPVVTVPMGEEPYHRPVFSNAHVAVYDVVLPLDAVMSYHEHPTNHLAVVVDTGRMRNEVLGRPPKVNPTGGSGTVVYLPAGPPHRQKNIGRTPVHFVAVEVLRSAAGDTTPAPGKEERAGPDPAHGCTVALEAADIRAVRCRLGPGEAAPGRPRSGPFLRVAVSGGRLSGAGAARERQFAAGTATWHEAGTAQPVTNAGEQVVEFVDLEWK